MGKVYSLCLLLSLLGVSNSQAPSLTCYNCDQSDTTCANPGASTPTTPNCRSCWYGVITFNPDTKAVTAFRRGCEPTDEITNQCVGGRCYCNSNNCNNQGFNPSFKQDISCYVCETTDHISTGCGSEFNAGGPFVHVEQGCSACRKEVTRATTGSATYKRECLRYTDHPNDEQCAAHRIDDCNTICYEDNCNSAQMATIATTSALLCLLAAFLFRN